MNYYYELETKKEESFDNVLYDTLSREISYEPETDVFFETFTGYKIEEVDDDNLNIVYKDLDGEKILTRIYNIKLKDLDMFFKLNEKYENFLEKEIFIAGLKGDAEFLFEKYYLHFAAMNIPKTTFISKMNKKNQC